MSHLLRWVAICSTLAVLGGIPQRADAFGMSGVGIKAGVNLTRSQAYSFYQGVGGQFDSHRWMFGTSLDLGSVVLPKLHFIPGVDLAIQNNVPIELVQGNTASTHEVNLRIFVANTDFVYFFHQSPKGRGYAGGGLGLHFYRYTDIPNSQIKLNDTKISLNVPLGFQRKLGEGMAWFGEMKLVIADDEKDSALQFTVGFAFGSFD